MQIQGSKIKMAPKRPMLLQKMINEQRRRRRLLQESLAIATARRQLLLKTCLLVLLLIFKGKCSTERVCHRSCRRLLRANTGWWRMVWESYSDKRFKQTFRVNRSTFNIILSRIRHRLERETVTEEPISPEFRLAICLYRLARGDYIYSIAEMVGLGQSTVSTIINEVSEAIVTFMWDEFVGIHMPKSEKDFKEKILDMEELWQFPFSWGAVDGCHIPIKCPPGGNEACKEYHNFKNFYSIVLMSIVDAKYRFVWGSCGFPGNSHDSIILQSTKLWSDIKDGKVLPPFVQKENEAFVPPLLLGDSAFPFETFLMKPYTNAVLSEQQSHFNYRLSRARMVVEGAYGQLKGRWRHLMRKSGGVHERKLATLACMILHNVCLDNSDAIPAKLDLTTDPNTSQRRDREVIREILMMNCCRKVFDTGRGRASAVRETITKKLWEEKCQSKAAS